MTGDPLAHIQGASVARCDLCGERCARLSYCDRLRLCGRCYVNTRTLAALVRGVKP